ncbi:MAG: response regulator [Candidatus Hydrogenedentes bacterium]|nr:response regulator [Candidatus Hydrogenedentota bacterium]
MKIRILLVDDHAGVRESLGRFLRREPDIEIVGEAEDGRAAVTVLERLHPDVVLMDVLMPAINGIEATRVIKRRWPETRVIALSVHSHEGYISKMLEAGASDYILKDNIAEELLHAIRSRKHPESEETKPAQFLPRGHERILIVDDEKALLSAIERLLRSLGYEVTALSSSLEALQAVIDRPHWFDLIVTDLGLPETNGLELASEIHKAHPSTPVILISGDGEVFDGTELSAGGVKELLRKPFDLATVSRVIRRVLDATAAGES